MGHPVFTGEPFETSSCPMWTVHTATSHFIYQLIADRCNIWIDENKSFSYWNPAIQQFEPRWGGSRINLMKRLSLQFPEKHLARYTIIPPASILIQPKKALLRALFISAKRWLWPTLISWAQKCVCLLDEHESKRYRLDWHWSDPGPQSLNKNTIECSN